MNMKTAPRADRRWRAHYESRLISPEEAVAKVQSGNRIHLVTAHESAPLLAALLGRADELRDVELRTLGGMWIDSAFQNGSWSNVVRANTSFGTPTSREAIAQGITDYTIIPFGDEHRAIDLGRTGSDLYDFCWHPVTPPN